MSTTPIINKLSIGLNVLLIGLVIWMWSSKANPLTALSNCQTLLTKTEDSLKLYTRGMVNNSPIGGGCTQTPDPGSFVLNNTDVISMVSTYTTDHWQTINASYKFMKDSRCMWFSLARLKGFINEIETKSGSIMSAGGYKCCQTLGIRIYLAEYPTTQILNDFGLPQNYLNKTTVVMIPTYRSSVDQADHDFNPNYYVTNPSTFTCTPSISDTIQWSIPLTALSMNHGGIFPPPYPSQNAVDANAITQLNKTYVNGGPDFLTQAVDRYFYTPPHPNPYWNDTYPPITPTTPYDWSDQ